MQSLQFPAYEFRTRGGSGRAEIWDEVRARWVSLTPEEWVRQHVIAYLIREKGYSGGLLAVEKELRVHGMVRRTDVLAYDRSARPLLLVECKAPEVNITQVVFDQVIRYNSALGVPVMMVTNGLVHYCCRRSADPSSWEFLPEIPGWQELQQISGEGV